MKSILVPIGGSETDGPLLETALAAARPFCGHLEFLHIHVSAGQAAANIAHTEFAMGPALSSALAELDHKAKTRSTAAAQHFREFCMRSRVEISGTPRRTVGVTASWHEEDGQALNRIMFRARHPGFPIPILSHASFATVRMPRASDKFPDWEDCRIPA